jgi:plasmid stability protein
MSEVIIPDIDDEVLNRLQTRANHHGHSLQVELKRILEAVAREPPKISMSDFLARIEPIRNRTRLCVQTDSVELLREGRER